MARKIGKFILNVAIYIAIVAGILWGVPNFLVWKLGTSHPVAAITSGSMWPVLKRGDLVLIQHVDKGDLQVGDIVVWENDLGFTIHRIAELKDTKVITKGDANFTEDEPVAYEDIVGRTMEFRGTPVRIPYFGLISVKAGEIRN